LEQLETLTRSNVEAFLLLDGKKTSAALRSRA